jgi:hypothetical protein
MANIIPKKIKVHKKVNYPTKRNNYRRYNNAKWKWEDVLSELDILKENETSFPLKIISEKYNIKYSTLGRKYKEWKKMKI